MRVLGVILVLVLGMGAAFAHPRDEGYAPDSNDFAGTWQNVEVRQTQVLRIIITPQDRDRVNVQIYGLCRGEPCSFGSAEGYVFRSHYPRERDQDNGALLVKIRKDFVHGDVLVRFNGRGEIVTHALLAFEDGRGPVYSVERFAPARRSYHEGYHGDEGRPYNNGYNGYNGEEHSSSGYEERYRRY